MIKKLSIIITLILMLPSSGFAKGAAQFMPEIRKAFPQAEQTEALVNAQKRLDLSTVHSYVVLREGGIPAERAPRFINWGNYDYRGVNIDLETGGVSTRTGKVYTYLPKGEILAVAKTYSSGRKIYIEVITPEPYIPANQTNKKHHSRVTSLLIFKMPKEVRKSGDKKKALDLIYKWIVPFRRLEKAEEYSMKIAPNLKIKQEKIEKEAKTYQEEKKEKKEEKKEKRK